jgi:myo-inositol-1(or 4)-monophosphatase
MMNNFRPFAVSLALKAGDIMRQNFRIGMDKEWKEDNSPLTVTDIAINDLVISKVKKRFPDHGIIAEEGSSFHDEEYVWVCDPVDGTKPFSHGYPTFTFSLALVQNGRPILGLLHDPILSRLIIAELGKGACLNDKLIRVSGSSSLTRSLVGFEISDPRFDKLRGNLIRAGCSLITFACISYSSLLVAIGEFKAAMLFAKTPWDGAAVQIIVEEAGGICTDILGNNQRYDREINGLVASNKSIHPRIIEMIKECL